METLKKYDRPNRSSACLLMMILWTFCSSGFSQSITVNADNYRHVFEGAGTSIGLYLGHHFSMNSTNQDLALQLINKECNMMYLQDYIKKYPSENPANFDKIANYILASRNHRADNSVSIVMNNFPDDLRTEIDVDGEIKKVLDVERPGIYDDLANWYFEVLKALKEREVDVDILSITNEPDFKKKHNYGFGDQKKGVSFILKEAVPKLKAMINDPAINTVGLEIPRIMAPSTLGPTGCLNFVNYFKENYPEAWEQIDIVATHQYYKGAEVSTFDDIVAAIDGKPFFQSEMHAGRGDGLDDLPIEKPHENCLSVASLIGASINSGVNAWFYFINNYPQSYHPGGLIQVPWNGTPEPYKQYYAFRQLTSTQPTNSHVVERSIDGLETNEVITFRKMGENITYLNVSNFEGLTKKVNINLKGTDSKDYGIKAIQVWSTDAERNGELITEELYTKSRDVYAIDLEPYSVNSLKITLDPNGFEQTMLEQVLSFSAIADQDLNTDYILLKAELSSSLEAQYKLIEGNVSIVADTVFFNESGLVTVRAYHPGTDVLLTSNSITQSFCVNPKKPTITIDGITLTSSSETDNQWFKDGEQISASSSGQTYEVVENGNYSVSVGSEGCYSTSEQVFVDLTVTSVKEQKPADNFLISNTGGSVTIQQVNGGRIELVQLLTISGHEVFTRRSINQGIYRIDISGLRAGVYLIRILDTDGKMLAKRILKF